MTDTDPVIAELQEQCNRTPCLCGLDVARAFAALGPAPKRASWDTRTDIPPATPQDRLAAAEERTEFLEQCQRECGLTRRRWVKHDDAMRELHIFTMRDLVACLDTNPAQATAAIKRAKTRGLVERIGNRRIGWANHGIYEWIGE